VDAGATRNADPDREGGPGTSAEAFAGRRAESLRRMFPGGRQPMIMASAAAEPAAAPAPAPGREAEPGPGTSTEATAPSRRRWWWLAAAVLALAAAAGGLTLRPAAGSGEEPVQQPTGQPLAALPPATGISLGPEPAASSAAASARTSAAPSSAPASAAKPAAPTKAATSKPAPEAKTTTAAPEAAVPISGYSACTTKNAAVFSVTFNVEFTWRHAFIDVDGDAHTGYHLEEVRGGLGADYMIENGVLFRSRGTQWSWVEAGAVGQSLNGGSRRWQVPLASIGSPAGLKVAYNGSGNSPDATTPALTAGAC
jgi:hypothetical protein